MVVFSADFMPLNNKDKLLLPFDNFLRKEKKICFQIIKILKIKLKTYRTVSRRKFEKNGMKFDNVPSHFSGI